MTFEEAKNLVSGSIAINKLELDNESLNQSKLVDRILCIMLQEFKIGKAMQLNRKKLYKELWIYYAGKDSAEVYRDHPLHLKILRNDLTTFIESDDRMLALDAKIIGQQIVVDYLERTLKQVERRGYDIKNSIEWSKWTTGGH